MGAEQNRIALLFEKFSRATVLLNLHGGIELNLSLILKEFLNLGRRTSGEASGAYIKYVSKPNPEVQRPQGLKGAEYAV